MKKYHNDRVLKSERVIMETDFSPETERLFYQVFEKDLIQNSIRLAVGDLTPNAIDRIFRRTLDKETDGDFQ